MSAGTAQHDSRRPRSMIAGAPKPRAARTQAYKELQAYWYAKLKRTRFNEEGKPDPKGELFHDLDPQNNADRKAILLMNTDRGPRRQDGMRMRKFVTLSELKPANPAEEADLEQRIEENARVFGLESIHLSDTPTARAWQAISRHAHDLPVTYKHRSFLVDLAQTGVVAEFLLRRHKLTRRAAIWAFDKFLVENGMENFQDVLVRGPVRPR